ncbi:serine/threonine-protein phosphatase [Microbacterium sp. SSW1-49]|uniref:Serine/threonine-protein phosphatase n=1 Tax=Microbacterium croceum TaxID=2851645 RepID=A0ABT0FHL4_9MICO|nr:PP2C family protein-serine/threonine phosphatase [Microbacterium croceum]MCK2037537.1 serine/threonine-protein phosphatase [Microbacterium croceum]
MNAPTRGRAQPSSIEEAMDLLARQAMKPCEDGDVGRALDLVRAELDRMGTVQVELTEALIASQDRVHAMKALAQINVQGVASDATIGLLLEKALTLTDASLVFVFTRSGLVATAGDTTRVDSCVELATQTLAHASQGLLWSTPDDGAMVGALDPDGATERYVGFFRPDGHAFSTVDIPLVEAIVSALGVMLAFNELHQHELAQAAVEREHQLASALAQSVITDQPPVSPRIDIFARTTPASLTGGDFYVFGQTDGSIWFAVGDVAGKSLPAAMLMTRAVAACRIAFLANHDASVVEAFSRIEDELFDHLDDVGLFITMVVGVVDEAQRTVSLVNAGHSPVVVVRDGETQFVPASVPPVGVVRNRVPRTETVFLDHDDCVILGSDGLAEQSDPRGELFGYDRFRALCEQTYELPTAQLGEAIFDAVDAFAKGSPVSDDATLVVFKRAAVER